MNHLFRSKVNVIRVTPVDTLTGEGEAETTHIENLPCRIVQPRGTEEIRFGKVAQVVDLNLYCAVRDIIQSDRISYNSDIYEILNIKTVEHGAGSFFKIALGLAK